MTKALEIPKLSVFIREKMGMSRGHFNNKKNGTRGLNFSPEEEKEMYHLIGEYIEMLTQVQEEYLIKKINNLKL